MTEMKTLEELVENAELAKKEAFDAQLVYEQSLINIIDSHGNTFFHNQQWYQVRQRDSAIEGRRITYLCELKDEPKTWLKGPKGSKKRQAEAKQPVESIEKAVEDFLEANEAAETTTVIE